MNWLQEVAHVARKDVQEERWLFASYAGVILLAVARGMGSATGVLGVLELLPLLVVLLGVLVVASVVQSDSPTQTDVFWATRPLRPMSVLSAKLALSLGAVLLAGALGQFVFLWLAGAPRLEALGLAAHAARVFGLWLILALVIGTVTRDLKGFVLAMIGLAVGFGICASLLSGDTRPYALRWAEWTLQVLAVAAAVVFLARRYHRRELGWQRWPEAIAVTGVVFVALFWPAVSIDASPVARSTRAISLRIETSNWSLERDELTLLAVVDSAPDDQALSLTEGAFIVTLGSGEKLRLPLTSPPVKLSDPQVRLAGMQEAFSGTDPSRRHYQLSARLLEQQRSQIKRGIAGISLEGTITGREARVIGSMPLSPGARLRYSNGSAELVRVRLEGGNLGITLVRRSVGGTPNSLPTGGYLGIDVPYYMLANPGRGELMRIPPQSASSGLGWGVLPAGGVTRGTIELQSRPSGSTPYVSPDDAWLRDARLLILDWTLLASYDVHATIDAASLARINSPAPRTSPSAN